MASAWGNAETVQPLIQHRADANTCNGSHKAPMASVVHLLLKHGASLSVDVEDYGGQTPLWIAC